MMKGVESGAWVAPTEGQQFPATLSLQPESQQGLSRLSLSSSLLMLQEWPLPHCCSSLSSKLLCTSFPCVPWRCEGHSPSQPSLPPQAQDPSTGCSWMASSCGSAPGAEEREEMVPSQGKERAGLVSEFSVGCSHSASQKNRHPSAPPLGKTLCPVLTARSGSCLHPTILIPAAVGTLPHWRRGPELKPSLLPPENWREELKLAYDTKTFEHVFCQVSLS